MPSVFIDANILLGFWCVQERRVPSELLQPLVDLSDHLLITTQVVHEVERNKLNLYIEMSKGLKIAEPKDLPAHLDTDPATLKFNEGIATLKKQIDLSNKAATALVEGIAEKISQNADLPTETLRPLFENAKVPTQQQLETARDRRERGNPPGKRNDPLGDQISWQQFLDALAGEQRVWLITRDGDFAKQVGRKRLLDPFLRAELEARGVKTIEVHDTLAGALKSIKTAGLMEVRGMEIARLEELETEEELASYPAPPYLVWPDRSWECPNCHKQNSEGGLTAHPSGYGGWSYWAHCRHCGYRFDTGEAYDD